MVYVTHDQSEALNMSNRIAVFNDGIIQQLAPPDDLYERPDNAFVAAFIGENNRLLGKVTASDGDLCTVEVDGASIQALSVNHSGVGSNTTLSLRPERVTIGVEEGSHPNVFPAKVEEIIYLGDHVRTRFSICGHDDFVVKMPNSAGHAVLAEGETVNVGWFAEDCRALDA